LIIPENVLHVAARRWIGEGRRISIVRTLLGCDFNDLARAW
jgi:hypothetical protein